MELISIVAKCIFEKNGKLMLEFLRLKQIENATEKEIIEKVIINIKINQTDNKFRKFQKILKEL